MLSVPRSYDEHVHDRFPVGDPSKRAFTYFVLTGGRFIYASALRLAVLKFILSMTVRFNPHRQTPSLQKPAQLLHLCAFRRP